MSVVMVEGGRWHVAPTPGQSHFAVCFRLLRGSVKVTPSDLPKRGRSQAVKHATALGGLLGCGKEASELDHELFDIRLIPAGALGQGLQ